MNILEMRRVECQMQMLGNGYWVSFVNPRIQDETQGHQMEVFSTQRMASAEFQARVLEFGVAKFGQFNITRGGDLEIVPTEGELEFNIVMPVLHEAGMFTDSSPSYVASTLSEKQRVQLFSEIVSGAIIVDHTQDEDSNA